MANQNARYLRVPRLLEQLARARHPQTLAQLAQRLDLPKTSLMRILSTLMNSGFVVQVPNAKGFILGPRAARLALDILDTPHFARAVQVILARLVAVTGESCNLTAPAEDCMRYLARAETKHPLRLTMEVGSHVPLHCTATGKLTLALMDKALLKQVLDRIPLSHHTPNTLTDRTKLERELVTIRQRRVGIDHEEFVLGMVAIAVPIIDAKGDVVAALSCHGATARVSVRSLLASVPAMHESADAIVKVLGGNSECT